MIFEFTHNSGEFHTMQDGRQVFVGREVPVTDLASLKGKLICLRTYKYHQDPWFGHHCYDGILDPNYIPGGEVVLLNAKTKEPKVRPMDDIVYLMEVLLTVSVKPM
jgi:hypothetical protein